MRFFQLFRMVLIAIPFSLYANNYAHWMHDIKKHIGNKPLNQIVLPGTHDSATYRITAGSRYAKDNPIPKWLTYISNKYPWLPIRKIYAGWSRNQPLSIREQLNLGIRYLDIRLCYDELRQKLYSCHGMYSSSLDEIIEDIHSFNEHNPDELIIIHIQHTTNIPNTLYQQALTTLSQLFNQQLVPNTYLPSVTCSTLWQTPYRIILIGEKTAPSHHNVLIWSSKKIDNPWVDTANPDQLINELLVKLKQRSFSHFFSTQAIISPNKKMILKGLPPLDTYNPHSIESMAKKYHKVLIDFVKNTSEKYSHNIVMLDWIDEHNSLVSWAVEHNKRLTN